VKDESGNSEHGAGPERAESTSSSAPAELPPLLTTPLLAQLLGLSRHGVRAMLRRGELPARRLGKQWVVRREALEAHLKQQELARRRAAEHARATVDRLLRAMPRLRG
jgi:excisionase family DNA binding protein